MSFGLRIPSCTSVSAAKFCAGFGIVPGIHYWSPSSHIKVCPSSGGTVTVSTSVLSPIFRLSSHDVFEFIWIFWLTCSVFIRPMSTAFCEIWLYNPVISVCEESVCHAPTLAVTFLIYGKFVLGASMNPASGCGHQIYSVPSYLSTSPSLGVPFIWTSSKSVSSLNSEIFVCSWSMSAFWTICSPSMSLISCWICNISFALPRETQAPLTLTLSVLSGTSGMPSPSGAKTNLSDDY